MSAGRCGRAVIVGALMGVVPVATGQGEPPAQPAQPQPAIPSIDELLGTGEGSAAPDVSERLLDEVLSGEAPRDRFARAVRLMDLTARRIAEARDTGLATQRLQEEILRNLEALIRDAQRQQQQQQQRSSQQQQQQRGQQSQPDQRQASENRRGENRDERMPPARQEGPLNPEIAPDGAQWGFLPERVREALRQGSSDTFSSLYRALTEAYYRRIAEEAGRR